MDYAFWFFWGVPLILGTLALIYTGIVWIFK